MKFKFIRSLSLIIFALFLFNCASPVGYIKTGQAYYRNKQYDSAIAEFNKAIEADPRNALAYNERGIAYLEKRQFDIALNDLTRSIELNPRDAIVYSNRAIAYNWKGEFDLAISETTKALELKPRLVPAYLNRAIAYNGKGQYDLAISDTTRALELDPRLADAYVIRADAYNGKGQYDLAIADATRASELNPRLAMAYNTRSIAYWFKGEFELSIVDAAKVVELNPKSAAAYINRGISYSFKGQHDLAVADLTKATELNPKDPNMRFHFGFVHYKARNKEEARKNFFKAKEIDSEIIKKRAEYFEKPMNSKTKEFYAEEMLCASEYLDVPLHVTNIAKKLLGKEEVSKSIEETPPIKPSPPSLPISPQAKPSTPLVTLSASALVPELLVGKVTSLHGDIVELDIGAVQGAKVGDLGRILYKVTIDGKEKPVYLARFRITHISEKSCMARIEESTGEVRVGHMVEIKLLEEEKTKNK